ncbi:hypothetical protein BFP77_05270 [Maribacter sp. 4U21]|uniref:DUF6048 family protein n=1 Tax=Maribacter sp. 4U21 TaxID=1889779 RepID=UPI000C15E99C|nr:DUF6048 family protein [Maribacter sp. 4U21]PIB30031.1 hypothetical protein BFP77_05270 [Maribacter sp. 4U21]
MSKSFISTFLFFSFITVFGQSKPIDTKPKDTVVYEQSYGLRAGIDLSRLILTSLDDNYTGFEIVADYRLTQKLYIAAELGNEKRTKQEDLYNFTTSGSYIKVGVDNNTYANWYGEQNSVFMGARLAFSTFENTLNNYQLFDSNRYWNPEGFAPGSNEPEQFSGLNAAWIEALFGTKIELFSNIFLGASIRLGFLFTDAQDGRFPLLWVPGFNKVTWDSKFGVGYNYSISYFLPLYKKKNRAKKKIEELENEEK